MVELCEEPARGHLLIQHHTIYEVTQASTSSISLSSAASTLLTLLQSVRVKTTSMDIIIVTLLILIMLGLLISAGTGLVTRESLFPSALPERKASKDPLPRPIARRPEPSAPAEPPRNPPLDTGRTRASLASQVTHRSSTTSEGGLKALQLAQRPFLSDLPRNLRRQLTWELGEPIRGDRQQLMWQVLDDTGRTFLEMNLDEFEGGLTIWDTRLLATVTTELLHATEWKSPQILGANGELFAEIAVDGIFGASLLLPDQISSWGQRFVVKDARTGATIFNVTGTWKDQCMKITDAVGHSACQLEKLPSPQSKLVTLEEGSDPVLMLCILFAVEKMRLVLADVRASSSQIGRRE
ncbi:unnamed protein product [Durusdinium trenchii]|uniref:Phospholipid scramblase n=2 Tax=Durusdinium trenchii TaxID=1381693 RepID=A0ABP0P0X7_9DINO